MPSLPATHLFFGGDYNPEQWPESVWLENMRLMKEAGVEGVGSSILTFCLTTLRRVDSVENDTCRAKNALAGVEKLVRKIEMSKSKIISWPNARFTRGGNFNKREGLPGRLGMT